jgi:spore coat protein U-like protein
MSANATTASTTFGISATVVASCGVTATALAFGNYTGVVATTTSTLTVTCSNSTTYNVGLSAGSGTNATVTTRSMTGPSSASLGYQLYQDSGYSTYWGQTVGTDTLAGTGTGSAQSITVYGQIPASEYVTPGSFSDTITATITY